MKDLIMGLRPEQIREYALAIVMVIIVLFLGAILWRNQDNIGGFLGKKLKKIFFSIKDGSAGVDFGEETFNDKKSKDAEEESKEESVGPKEVEEDNGQPQEEDKVPETLEEWEREMFWRALMREEGKMQIAFEAAVKLTATDESKHFVEIDFADYRVRFLQDDSYIEKIGIFADPEKYTQKVVEKAYSSLGGIWFQLKDYKKSIANYESALGLATDDSRRCYFERRIARSRFETGEKEVAFSSYGLLLNKYNEAKHQIVIYKELAELYEESGNNELRALATEKALELGDNNHQTYFNAAYAYSHSDLDKLSLLHYQRAVQLGSGEWSLNNMGVQYEQLSLPLKSIENYQNAFSKNNTLAAANIAYRLIGAGFLGEAKKVLEEAQAKKAQGIEVHENVYSALASIKAEQEKEEKREGEILKEATSQQEFFRGYAERYFVKSDVITIDVNYFPERDATVHVEVNNGKIIGTWSRDRKSLSSDYEWTEEFKFEGELHNNAAKIKFFEKTLLTNNKFEEVNEGFLYIQDSEHIKLLMQNKYNKQNYTEAEIVKKM